MFSRLICAKFAILLGLFSYQGLAAAPAGSTLYRLPHIDADAQAEIARPKIPFPNVPQIFRVYNLAIGAPFSSLNSEFVIENGALKRVSSQKVNHVMQMMLDRVNENLICEQRLQAGVVKNHIGPMEAWTERTVGPIDRQALKEMNARKYIDRAQVDSYANSTGTVNPDRMIYLESLSWLTASQALAVFDGALPWARISEVEAPPGLGSFEVRKLAEAGDPRVRLRIRRATLRLVASHVFNEIPETGKLELYSDPLPFAEEYTEQGIELPNEPDEILYRYELGRASQIPGLEGEAEKLSALAGLVMWHHSMTFEDIRTGKKADVRHVDANIYMHALKRTHRMMYTNHFGAKEYATGKKPHDVVVRVGLKQFLAKTLPTLGLDPANLREVAIKADSIDAMRLDLDWTRGNRLMTRRHPITIRLSRPYAAQALKSFTRDVTDPQLKEKWIQASLAMYDHVAEFQFPETSTVDGYDHKKHFKINADYFVSGIDSWSASNPGYAPAFVGALATFFKGVRDETTIAVVVPQTPDGSSARTMLYQLRQLGFEPVPVAADDPAYFNGPFVTRIKLGRLMEVAKAHPEVANEVKHAPTLKSGTWRALREINLLPGL